MVAVSKLSILLGRWYNMEEGAMVEEKEKAYFCFCWITMAGWECAGAVAGSLERAVLYLLVGRLVA